MTVLLSILSAVAGMAALLAAACAGFAEKAGGRAAVRPLWLAAVLLLGMALALAIVLANLAGAAS